MDVNRITHQTNAINHQAHEETIRLSNLPLDILFEKMTRYLKVSEAISLMMTCKHLLSVSESSCLWETIRKIQVHINQYSFDRFTHHINLFKYKDGKEPAYKQLCKLAAQGREPWALESIAGFPEAWSFLRGPCRDLAILSNKYFVIEGTSLYSASIWSIDGTYIESLIPSDLGRWDPLPGVSCIAPLKNGAGFVTADLNDPHARCWARKGRLIATLRGHAAHVTCIAVLQNGNIVTGSKDCTAIVWLPNGTPHVHCHGHAAPITCVAVLQDGNFITGSADHTARIWSPEGEPRATFMIHTGSILCVMVLSNGNIVTGAADHKVSIWSNIEGPPVAILTHHAYPEIHCMADLANSTFAVVNFDTIYIWSYDGHLIGTAKGHTGKIHSIAALPGGGFVTGSSDCTAMVWSPIGVRVARLMHKKAVRSVKVFPNGNILTGSLDGIAHIWKVNIEALINPRTKNGWDWTKMIDYLVYPLHHSYGTRRAITHDYIDAIESIQ